ncbi:MAG: DUF4143 domain-containing protein [Lachnospiraceae bacterium]|nr:DUF4143 domain-containing protein [Lachnospiraceae bacterium]
MKRNAVNKLIEWKESGTTVPFLLHGTKGVGKTYLAIEFANAYYPQYLYVNFELNKAARDFFEEKAATDDTVSEIFAEYFQLDEVYLTGLIVILDEISFCPLFFNRLAVECNSPVIAISGGVLEREKLNRFSCCRVFPLGFDEFLSAVGSDWYVEIIQGHFLNAKPMPDIVHQELLALFEEYLVVGGMPAAINEYIASKSVYNVGEVHSLVTARMKSVLEETCDEKTLGMAVQVLDVLPKQLKKANKRFRFNLIRKGVTYALYKDSIEALVKCGMVLKLDEQKGNPSQFKLYFPDVGMMSSAYMGEESEHIRKALLENYVMQTLETNEVFQLCFWESEAQAKVDFVLRKEDKETAVELRTSTSGKAKSIASYQTFNQCEGQKYYRFGFENFYSTSVIMQVPYYAVFCVK